MNKACEPPDWQSGTFEQRFFINLMRLNRLLYHHIDQHLRAHRLSPAQLWFLKRLHDAGTPQPISYFADGVFSSRSNATQMIDRLQAEGLVRRLSNRKDRRSVLVQLTDAGLQRLCDGRECQEALLEALLEPLTAAERDATRRAFERVLQLLQSQAAK